MGETPLQVLADNVNVLEVALHQVPLIDRRHASGLINGVDNLDRQMNRVCGAQPQGRALVQSACAGRYRLGPEIANHFVQEGSSGSEVSFAVPYSRLNQRLIPEHCLHGPRFLGACQFEKRGETGAGQSQGYCGIARGEEQAPGNLVERSGLQQRGISKWDGPVKYSRVDFLL
jgi:hypothetical protein